MLRALAVTSRRHPIAVGSYTGVTILATLYLADIAQASLLTSETNKAVAMLWQITLLAGGAIALGGVLAPDKRLLTGLGMEALGAWAVGVCLATYSVVMATTTTSIPWASTVVFGAVAVGCLTRAWTAWRDRRRLIQSLLAQKVTVALAEADQ